LSFSGIVRVIGTRAASKARLGASILISESVGSILRPPKMYALTSCQRPSRSASVSAA
jgi:hypothetical protein